MKKLILSFAVALLCVPTTAQQYIIINNETPILVSDVDKIIYGRAAGIYAYFALVYRFKLLFFS